MYRRTEIMNFRSLESFVVEDLGRLNLFVGPNNVGKTSLLEALWLLRAPGNPALTLNLALSRGFNIMSASPAALWHPLFYDMDISRRIEIGATTIEQEEERFTISLSQEWVGDLPTSTDNTGGRELPVAVAAATTTIPPETLAYEFVTNGDPPLTASFSLGFGRVNVIADPEFAVRFGATDRPSTFLPARQKMSPEELADRFTRVQDVAGVEPLLQSLKVLQPGLTALFVGFSQSSRQPSVRAHVRGLGVPVPLQLLGEGSTRLMEILLAISSVRDGLLLVDEIENGLYYRNLELAWQSIDTASREAKVQIFATTHSYECVEAAVRALSGRSAEALRLHRIERKDSELEVVTYDHATAEATLAVSLEFR
jgi:hypothetical protein